MEVCLLGLLVWRSGSTLKDLVTWGPVFEVPGGTLRACWVTLSSHR